MARPPFTERSHPPSLLDPIVGIDLGTTNSLVAIADQHGPRIISDPQGRPLLPSVVRYEIGASKIGSNTPPTFTTTVGHQARDNASSFPRSTIASIKRLMGRSLKDAADDLQYLGYEVVEGANNTARVRVTRSQGTEDLNAPALVVSPPEVSAEILRRLKDQASAALGTPVHRAVVTVPAYFDDAQRQATRDAGRLAGLEIVRLVAEPTAAALAYGLGLEQLRDPTLKPKPRTVAVYDLGGGTFDISILRLTPAENLGDTAFFQVLATAGDTHLGGDDVDNLIVQLVRGDADTSRINTTESTTSYNIPPAELQSLKLAAEAAKCALSEHESATIGTTLQGRPLTRTITRAELETLITPWVEQTLDSCRRVLRDAARREDSVTSPDGTLALDAVVMVGGSTRIPLVRRRVGELFGLEPYTAIDPDQVVALGAAVQAGVISGVVKGSLLLDVIPLSLGIETVGGAVAKVIIRNATVPTRAKEMFSTSVDNQTAIKLTVYQGEREMAADCRKLGLFELRGLPPMPAGIPQVEVEFLVDANGVLNVSAHERRSGKRAALQVAPNHGLSREEVARIESESFVHAREDMSRHRVVDLIVNSKLDVKWISERLEKHHALLDLAYADALAARLAEVRSFIASAEKDWKSVNANTFAAAKTSLDEASVRLQEIGVRESLRSG